MANKPTVPKGWLLPLAATVGTVVKHDDAMLVWTVIVGAVGALALYPTGWGEIRLWGGGGRHSKKLLLAPSISPAEINEKWRGSANAFSTAATLFWDGVRDQFRRYGHVGNSIGDPRLLDTRVLAALWPDEPEDGPLMDRNEDGTETHVSRAGSALLLKDFVGRLYKHDTEGFDPHRKDLSKIANEWWSWANYAKDADRAVFETWLARELGTANVSTTKLLWYVNAAYAEVLRAPGKFQPYEWLRAVLAEHEQAIIAAAQTVEATDTETPAPVKRLIIFEAQWRAVANKGRCRDVTDIVEQAVRENALHLEITRRTFPDPDPAPSQQKECWVRYAYDGRQDEKVKEEGTLENPTFLDIP